MSNPENDNTVTTEGSKGWMFLVGAFLILIAVGVATS